jgi:putative intracellular protease/amidase
MSLNILILVTSHALMGGSGKPTGLWAEELATPYYQLADAGVQITLASPRGGVVPLDPASLKPAGQNEASVERMLGDATLQQRLAHSLPLASLQGQRFDAVFMPGGHGTMWDLPQDPQVIATVQNTLAAGRWVASVCHGVAGLVGARRPDGQPVVAGLRVNSFTDEEERAVGLDKAVPFLLESRLRELGARFESGPAWQPYVVQDGLLITGQNPQSSALVAQALLKALGLKPAATAH